MKHIKPYNENKINKVPDASERRVFAHYFFVTDPKTPGYQKNLDMYFAIIPDLTEFDLVFIMKWDLPKPNKPIEFQKERYEGTLEQIYLYNQDVNIMHYGITSLHVATLHNDKNIAKYLIDAGADINIQDEDGNTALICASRKGHKDIANLLIESGADLNIQSTNIGYTALMWACDNEHIDVVKLLIESGANLNLKNKWSSTALKLCRSTDIINLLKKHGAKK